mmetsp:Transcript_85951/g.172057  ORF Transcript_85951/g.172057 Transcript_85951/m.172057 type:complete len:214 (-) Transcript_85951:836-1477(-)
MEPGQPAASWRRLSGPSANADLVGRRLSLCLLTTPLFKTTSRQTRLPTIQTWRLAFKEIWMHGLSMLMVGTTQRNLRMFGYTPHSMRIHISRKCYISVTKFDRSCCIARSVLLGRAPARCRQQPLRLVVVLPQEQHSPVSPLQTAAAAAAAQAATATTPPAPPPTLAATTILCSVPHLLPHIQAPQQYHPLQLQLREGLLPLQQPLFVTPLHQ